VEGSAGFKAETNDIRTRRKTSKECRLFQQKKTKKKQKRVLVVMMMIWVVCFFFF